MDLGSCGLDLAQRVGLGGRWCDPCSGESLFKKKKKKEKELKLAMIHLQVLFFPPLFQNSTEQQNKQKGGD